MAAVCFQWIQNLSGGKTEDSNSLFRQLQSPPGRERFTRTSVQLHLGDMETSRQTHHRSCPLKPQYTRHGAPHTTHFVLASRASHNDHCRDHATRLRSLPAQLPRYLSEPRKPPKRGGHRPDRTTQLPQADVWPREFGTPSQRHRLSTSASETLMEISITVANTAISFEGPPCDFTTFLVLERLELDARILCVP
jgi:hypothetical protein